MCVPNPSPNGVSISHRYLQVLEKSLKHRQERWDEWRAICSISCKIHFQYNLANRGYYGVVAFDHEEQRLSIKVRAVRYTIHISFVGLKFHICSAGPNR